MSILNNDQELEQYIKKSLPDLTPAQVREIRLLAKDIIGITIDSCRTVAQNSVNEIVQLTKTSSNQ